MAEAFAIYPCRLGNLPSDYNIHMPQVKEKLIEHVKAPGILKDTYGGHLCLFQKTREGSP